MTRRVIGWRRIFGLREAGVYYALILLAVVLAVLTAASGRPPYLSAINITNVLYQSSLVAIMGVAMTVILITGNFDLSVASVAALSAAVLIGVSGTLGFWPAVGVALLVAAAVGLLNGAIVQFVGINAFIVTLGTLTAIRGVVLIVTNGRSLMAEDPDVIAAMTAFEGGRIGVFWPMLTASVVAILAGLFGMRGRKSADAGSIGALILGAGLAVVALLAGPRLTVAKPVLYMLAFTLMVWFVLRFTTIGRRIYAVGGNAEAARLSGINVHGYKLAAFILSSLAAGFAGVLFGCRLGSINPTALQGAELTVIAAAILGGTSLFGGAGSVIKTVAGALLLFTLTNGFNTMNLGANYQGVIEGTVVVVAAAIYTVGGTRRRRPRVAMTAAANPTPLPAAPPGQTQGLVMLDRPLTSEERRVKYSVPAVEKALDVIEYLSDQAVPMPQAQIARALGRAAGEIFRMLTCLESRGYLRRDPGNGGYALTLKLFELSRIHSPYEVLLRAALPHMRLLAETVHQSCHLSVLHHDQVLVLAQEESPRPFRLSVEVGSQHSPLRTTSGRVLLAALDAADCNAVLDAQPGWPRTKRDAKAELLARLGAIRDRGFEQQEGERFVGGLDLGVLVGSPESAVKAALTVAALKEHDGPDLDAVLPHLQRCAAAIAQDAGLTREPRA